VLSVRSPIPQDPWAHPPSWSSTNVIAVACGHDVYYQDLDTRQIAGLCNLPRPSLGRIRTLVFAPRELNAALRTTTRCVQGLDAASRRHVRTWPNTDWVGVSALVWRQTRYTSSADTKGRSMVRNGATMSASWQARTPIVPFTYGTRGTCRQG